MKTFNYKIGSPLLFLLSALFVACSDVGEVGLIEAVPKDETDPPTEENKDDDKEDDKKEDELTIGGLTNVDPNTFEPKFIPPKAPFILIEGEVNHEITYAGDSIEELQTLIDEAKQATPDEMVIVHLLSKVIVTAESGPLELASKTILSFDNDKASIMAEGSSAGSIFALVRIDDAQYVGIKGCDDKPESYVLNGKGLAKYGIYAENSGRINIDNISVANCSNNGIYLQGTSDTERNQASSVTRCTVYGCSQAGVLAKSAARYVISDNNLSYNNIGVEVISMSATIHNNTLEKNRSAAISVNVPAGQASTSYPYGVVTRNTVKDNPTGIILGDQTRGILVTENVVKSNSTGISMKGSYNRIFDNTLKNATQISNSSSSNIIMHNTDLDISDISGNVGQYFNPPTSDDRHTNKAIINGRARADLTITNTSSEPMSLQEVQSQLNSFKSKNSNKYIVLWLNGDFVADGVHTGLSITDYMSVVFDGTMYPEGDEMDFEADEANHYVKGSTNGGTQMVLFSGTNFASFSGGTIDCKHMPSWGMYAPSDNVLLIDDVAIKAAYANNIGTINHSGVSRPAFIHDCDFDGYTGPDNVATNRGVWVHVCEYIYCIGNTSKDHLADFVDLDAGGNRSKVLFNVAQDEGRCGVFVEEAVTCEFVMGNLFLGGDKGNGIGMYSSGEVASKRCTNNLLLFNTMTHFYGMNIRHGDSNFSFNNRVKDVGLYGVYLNAINNYSSQINFDQGGRFTEPEDNFFFTMPY